MSGHECPYEPLYLQGECIKNLLVLGSRHERGKKSRSEIGLVGRRKMAHYFTSHTHYSIVFLGHKWNPPRVDSGWRISTAGAVSLIQTEAENLVRLQNSVSTTDFLTSPLGARWASMSVFWMEGGKWTCLWLKERKGALSFCNLATPGVECGLKTLKLFANINIFVCKA